MRIEEPEGELLNILHDISPLEWRKYQQRYPEVRVGNSFEREDRSGYPPYVAFRFENESDEIVNKLRLVLEGYLGRSVWRLVSHKRDGLSGINWMIGPARLWEISEAAEQENMTKGQYLSKYEPWVGPAAYDDLPGLIEHVSDAFSTP
ncbi:hypothetical protein KJF94_09060 [Pseudomonas hormoni]|uniref:Uncharacterized protein n=1 Tax=Pseudomonas hormoni TaxID=3093767 RepID=A0ABX8F1S3_9PSED|nr:hypothetical protein [Pseudomonas hormoni]QVW25675.1 hypothetical protein KJF94_09060 [Pseudomonas hormoni]